MNHTPERDKQERPPTAWAADLPRKTKDCLLVTDILELARRSGGTTAEGALPTHVKECSYCLGQLESFRRVIAGRESPPQRRPKPRAAAPEESPLLAFSQELVRLSSDASKPVPQPDEPPRPSKTRMLAIVGALAALVLVAVFLPRPSGDGTRKRTMSGRSLPWVVSTTLDGSENKEWLQKRQLSLLSTYSAQVWAARLNRARGVQPLLENGQWKHLKGMYPASIHLDPPAEGAKGSEWFVAAYVKDNGSESNRALGPEQLKAIATALDRTLTNEWQKVVDADSEEQLKSLAASLGKLVSEQTGQDVQLAIARWQVEG